MLFSAHPNIHYRTYFLKLYSRKYSPRKFPLFPVFPCLSMKDFCSCAAMISLRYFDNYLTFRTIPLPPPPPYVKPHKTFFTR